MEVTDREGKTFGLTHARWQKLTRLLKQYEGWASSLRADYGHDLVTFLEESALLDERVESDEAAIAHVERGHVDGVPYETTLVDSDDVDLRVRAVETRTGLARTHRIRRSLFASPEYRALVKVHHQLIELAGQAPFAVSLGDQLEEALSFEALRETVLRVAQKGVVLNRFKGLGEMNPEQLRDTTMDPANRTLARVTVDDAAAADRIFSMLMGDQVEPRRDFIESNARLVANLDV